MNLITYRKSAKRQYPSILETDIDLIVAQVTDLPHLELFLNDERELSNLERDIMDTFLKRRSDSEPLQYIFEEAAFRNYIFCVGKGVLIPRPETEILVDLVLKMMPENATVCDLGTGSGAIAISIALEKTDSAVMGVDLSELALQYARKNKDKYHADNLTLTQGDLFADLHGQKFNVLTANLPYVSKKLYDNLDCEVRSFEPETALLSGTDGLDLIRQTAKEALDYMYPGGSIIFEFSPEQENEIFSILKEYNYSNIEIVKDLNKLARFALANPH